MTKERLEELKTDLVEILDHDVEVRRLLAGSLPDDVQADGIAQAEFAKFAVMELIAAVVPE